MSGEKPRLDANLEALSALQARASIGACIARIARGEDRRDANILGACFWPDATCDFGIFGGGFDEYLAWVVPGSPAIPVTQHILGQSVIDLIGDLALAETYVTAYHRIDTGAEERDTVIGGRYLDRLEKRGHEWRIAQRTMLYDWYQDIGASVDWSHGLMGMKFGADHYTGRAAGDYSKIFFNRG